MLRTQNDTPFSCHECRKVCAVSCCLVIARGFSPAAIRLPFFKRIKSFCARAARAPYFCTDRNRGKNRRKPFQLGFRTFPNDQRDKLPFGNPYCIEMRYVPINNVSEKTVISCHCEHRKVRGNPFLPFEIIKPSCARAARAQKILSFRKRHIFRQAQNIIRRNTVKFA